MSSEMYREIIMDYYKHPRNFGRMENPTFKARDSNPLCGDEIEIQVSLDENRMAREVKFMGKGCAISQASASMLTEMLLGKRVDELRKLSKDDIFKALGNPYLGPVRVKCALLSLKVLKTGLYQYLAEDLELDEDLKI